MKIIIFETGYSNYINDLSKMIKSKLSSVKGIELISTFYSDKIYFPDAKYTRLKAKDKKDDIVGENIDKVRKIKNLANLELNLEGDELELLSRYYSSIEEILRGNKSSIVIVYNDLRWVSSYVIEICKKNDIFYVVFERGVFRPHTTTMDFSGVNANSSINKAEFESNSQILEGFDLSRKDKSLSTNKFAFYFFSRNIERFLLAKVGAPTPDYSKKKLLDYISLIVGKNKNKSASIIDDSYYFVALQLPKDTQTIINSPFNGTQEFIDRVIRDYRLSNMSSINKVVFKIHPLDTNEYIFPEDVIVSYNDTEELISKSEGVITINSTVGFESCFSKKVVCCGDSFYTSHGFIYRARENENIFNVMSKSKVASDEYAHFILGSYQVPGSITNYTSYDLDYAAKKIIKSYLERDKCF